VCWISVLPVSRSNILRGSRVEAILAGMTIRLVALRGTEPVCFIVALLISPVRLLNRNEDDRVVMRAELQAEGLL
jgi:hypothetical protein